VRAPDARPDPASAPGPEGLLDDDLLGLAAGAARDAAAAGDAAIGAVVAHRGVVVSTRGEEVVRSGDPTAHAAVLALRDAAAALSSWRLLDCVLAVTLEPCVMCTGAAILARVGRVVIGERDALGGACGSRIDLTSDPRLNHAIEVVVLGRRTELGRRSSRRAARP